MNLPFVMRQTGRRWHGSIARRRLQATRQTARIVPMIVDQIGYSFAAMLFGQIVFGAMVLLDVIVLDVRLRTVREDCVSKSMYAYLWESTSTFTFY